MRRRSAPVRATAVLLAIAIHAAFGVALLSRPEAPGPQEVVMDVVLAPPWRSAPRPAERAKPSPPTPVRGRPRNRASAPAPIVAPADKAAPAVAPSVDWRVREPREGEDVRRTLRAGVGCRSADLLALTKQERQACDEKLAKGAKDAPLYAVVSPRLKKEFDGVFECPKDDVWCEYRIGKGPYPGLFASHRRKRADWD